MTTKSRRKHSAAPFVVWRRNSTDTNRGRSAVIAESDVLFESAYEPNDRPDNARISFTVRDRETGMTLNALRQRLEEALDGRRETLERAELDRRLREERIDVTLPGDAPRRGHLHLITQIRRQVEDVFLGLGYEIFDGPEIDDRWHNFTALNTPDWHPSTSPNDTFYLMTDALAAWFLRCCEAGQQPWDALEQVLGTADPQESFAAFVRGLREEKLLHNDDVTLLTIHVDQELVGAAATMPLIACEEPAADDTGAVAPADQPDTPPVGEQES